MWVSHRVISYNKKIKRKHFKTTKIFSPGTETASFNNCHHLLPSWDTCLQILLLVYLSVFMLIPFWGDPHSPSPICPWNLYGSWASCHGNKEYARLMVLPWIQLICSLIYSSFLGEDAESNGRGWGLGDWGKKKWKVRGIKRRWNYELFWGEIWILGHEDVGKVDGRIRF